MIDQQKIAPWKYYTTTVLETWLAFCLATFSIGMYLSYPISNTQNIICSILMGAAYLFIIVFCIRRIVQRLPIAALMLLVPIAPLAVLLLVISLLHLIQALH